MSAHLSPEDRMTLVAQFWGRRITTNADQLADLIAPAVERILARRLADAWDEGFQDGRRQDAEGDDGPRFVNPYRAET